MKIEDNTVVAMHYKLTDTQGNQIDSSEGGQPLHFLQGHQNIIPGLEREMTGKEKGNKFQVTVNPEDAYGTRNEQLVQDVPKTNFPNPEEVQIGMQFRADTPNGPMILEVKEIQEENVIVDGNHPLAGQTLNFDVEIVDVRAATNEEIEHRHVHGPGGHQH